MVKKLDGVVHRIQDPGASFKRDVPFNYRIVESSNVDRIGWPTTGEPLMVVRFMSGMTYVYMGVSRQRAVAASYASSVGAYINDRIKRQFKCAKIRGL